MKGLFTTLLVLMAIGCWADYSEESFFLIGKLYGANGKPLRNKEVLFVTGNRYFCFFATDKNGYYRVEVPYLVPCLSGPAGRTRFDDQAMEEAKFYNSNKIDFYCGNEYGVISNPWYKYYSQDTTCQHRDYFFHLPNLNTDCVTYRVDIYLKNNIDSGFQQARYKKKIDSIVKKINEFNYFPKDSIEKLELYYSSLNKYRINRKRLKDSFIAAGVAPDIDFIFDHNGDVPELRDSLQKMDWKLDDLSRAINDLFYKYQLYNRDISTIKEDLHLSDKIFVLHCYADDLTCFLQPKIFCNYYYFVFKTDKYGIISDFYDGRHYQYISLHAY